MQEKHQVRQGISKNTIFYICDECGQKFDSDKGTRINKGMKGEFAYCDDCMKKLYPNYRKISFQNSMNECMKRDMLDGLSRYEKLR